MITIFNNKSKDQQMKIYDRKYINDIYLNDLVQESNTEYPSDKINIKFNKVLDLKTIDILDKVLSVLNICTKTSFGELALKGITKNIVVYIDDNYIWVEVDIITNFRNTFFGREFINTKAIRTLIRNLSGVTKRDITIHFHE